MVKNCTFKVSFHFNYRKKRKEKKKGKNKTKPTQTKPQHPNHKISKTAVKKEKETYSSQQRLEKLLAGTLALKRKAGKYSYRTEQSLNVFVRDKSHTKPHRILLIFKAQSAVWNNMMTLRGSFK